MGRYRPGGGNHHSSSSRSHGPHDIGPVRFPKSQQRSRETQPPRPAFNSQNFTSAAPSQPGGSSIISMVAESLSKDNLTGGYQYLQPGWFNNATNGASSSDGEKFRNQNATTNYRSRPPLLPFPPGQERLQVSAAPPRHHRQEPQYAAHNVADESSTLMGLEQRMAEIQKQLDMLHEEEVREKSRERVQPPSSRHRPYPATASSSSFDSVSLERKNRELARMEQLLQRKGRNEKTERRHEPEPRNSPPRRRPMERSPQVLRPPSRVNDSRHSTRHSSRSREESSHHQKRREHRSPSPKRPRRDGSGDQRRRAETTSRKESVVSSGSGRSRPRSEKREERRRDEERKSNNSSRTGERPSSRGERKEERKADERKPATAEKKVLKLDEGDSERRKSIMASLSYSKKNKEGESAPGEEDEPIDDPLYSVLREFGQKLEETAPAPLSEILAKLSVEPEKKGIKYRPSHRQLPDEASEVHPRLEFYRRKPKDEKSFAVFQRICEERKASKGVKKEI